MEATLISSLLKDTKYVLQKCREASCPVIVQTWGNPVLVIMDVAAFDRQFKEALKLPKGHVHVAYRPLRMPISLLKGLGQTIDACNQADEPIYLQKYNRDELVMMNCAVYARLQEKLKPCH